MSFLQMYNYPLVELGFREFLRDPHDRLYDQHFGETLTANDVIVKKNYGQGDTGEYGRQWRPKQFKDSTSTITSDRNKFEVKLDVQRFGRDEVQVKIADGHIVVEAKHEEKQDDHGYVSRQFVRRYLIPADLAADDFESRLSADGVLTVIARRKGAVNDKIVPVKHTGPERKDNDQASTSQEKKKDPRDQGSSSQEKRVDPKDQSSSSQEKKVEPKDQGSSSQEQKEDPKKESKKDSQLRKMLK